MKREINLPAHEDDALKALADRRSISFTHCLRQAMKSELHLQMLKDAGSKLLVQESDGRIMEIVFSQIERTV